MAEVIGRVVTDLHPNGTVRMVFLQHVGGGFERPHTAENLDITEREFVNTLGLTPGKAASLRGELARDKMADAVITIEEEIVVMWTQPRARGPEPT